MCPGSPARHWLWWFCYDAVVPGYQTGTLLRLLACQTASRVRNRRINVYRRSVWSRWSPVFVPKPSTNCDGIDKSHFLITGHVRLGFRQSRGGGGVLPLVVLVWLGSCTLISCSSEASRRCSGFNIQVNLMVYLCLTGLREVPEPSHTSMAIGKCMPMLGRQGSCFGHFCYLLHRVTVWRLVLERVWFFEWQKCTKNIGMGHTGGTTYKVTYFG